MKKAELTLETVGKALLVLAVVIVLLIIFRNLIFQGGDNLRDAGNGTGNSLKDCFKNPELCELNFNNQGESGGEDDKAPPNN